MYTTNMEALSTHKGPAMQRYVIEQYGNGAYISTIDARGCTAREALLQVLDINDKLRVEITARPADTAVAVAVDGSDVQWHASRG